VSAGEIKRAALIATRPMSAPLPIGSANAGCPIGRNIPLRFL